jgi:hypothetical protein
MNTLVLFHFTNDNIRGSNFDFIRSKPEDLLAGDTSTIFFVISVNENIGIDQVDDVVDMFSKKMHVVEGVTAFTLRVFSSAETHTSFTLRTGRFHRWGSLWFEYNGHI